MRELSPEKVEFVYRRIAGHIKCTSCGKWIDPYEDRFGKYCSECLSKMLIPQRVYNTILETAQALRRTELFENESSAIRPKSIS